MYYIFSGIVALFFSTLYFIPLHAQESLTVSVTPPLFQMNVIPGQSLNTYVKVVNSNRVPLTVYAQVFDFKPQGEDGQGLFSPVVSDEEGQGFTLAHWITVSHEPIVVPPEQSVEVPVTLSIPHDASPGGHFAALLVGTRPPEGEEGVSVVRTSQVVTSLFFVRVAGDVHEEGTIREFSVARLIHETPEAQFVLRFENSGNVHLQPQGGITIYNMWGKKRGYIPINQKSHFGNVLPESIRKFDFSWEGTPSLADIGRYTAEVALVYGEDGRITVDRKTYFYVVPLKATFITLCGLGLLILFVTFMVRRYVRRVVELSGYEQPQKIAPQQPTLSMRDYSAPLREGVLDLRKGIRPKEVAHSLSLVESLHNYIRSYALFFGCLIGIAVCVFILIWFFSDVLSGTKEYEVTVERGDVDVRLTDEEVEGGSSVALPTEE